MWKFLVVIYVLWGTGSQAGPSSNKTGYEIITSQRGKSILLRAGFKYNKDRLNKDGSCNWRCSKRTVCKARIIIASNNCIKRDDRHNCVPDFVSNKSLGVKKVYFKSLREVTVPERFANFLLADYHTSNRILVFASKYCKTILANPNLTIICDSTFKYCLKPFQQLYTLHVDLGSSKTHTNIKPVVYALLANKARVTYDILFRLIKSQIPQFNPKTIILDFEKAAMLAVRDIFPETSISGCCFHFSRSLWRTVDKIGVTKSALCREHIKRCIELAHLPKEAIESSWLYVMSQCPNDKNILKFNDYFVETWLNETSFFADKWSCNNLHHCIINMVESWHSTVNKKINIKTKSIAHLLTILQEEDNYQTLYLKGANY